VRELEAISLGTEQERELSGEVSWVSWGDIYRLFVLPVTKPTVLKQ